MITIPADVDLVGQRLMLLGAVGLLFLHGCSGKLSHSLSVLYTLTSEPDRRSPQFVAKAYVDDQIFGFYDSKVREASPAVRWVKKVEMEDPTFWKWNTQRTQDSERVFRDDLRILQRRYNQTEGLHTWQRRYGCEISGADVIDAFFQYAYDGRDFLSLDVNTLTWTAPEAEAEVIKRRWENMPFLSKNRKKFLEEECIWWLRKLLEYGKDALKGKDAPVAKVTRKTISDEKETLVCQVYGFYPKEISTSWKRDGEDWEQETSRRVIAPNSDKTYHAWLSVDIDSRDRNRFHCHVEHGSLPEILIVAWEEPEGTTAKVIWGVILTVTFLLAITAVIIFCECRRRRRAVREIQEQRELRLLGNTQNPALLTA